MATEEELDISIQIVCTELPGTGGQKSRSSESDSIGLRR